MSKSEPTPLQTAILKQLRTRLADSALAAELAKWDDEQLLFRVFLAGHGLRLTRLGNQFMQHCFKCHPFTTTANPTFAQLEYLSSHLKLPYFIEKTELVVYDDRIAAYLQMVNGNLASLVSIKLEI